MTENKAMTAAPKRKRLLKKERILQIVVVIIFFILWEMIINLFHVPKYILPAPSGIFQSFYQGFFVNGILPYNTYITLLEAVIGLGIGVVFGFILGVILAELPVVHSAIRPFLVATQVMPKTALAPIFIIWFGFGIYSKIFIVILLTFFPVLINTVAGVSGADADRLALMKSYGVGRLKTLRLVKLPGAMPQIMSGIEVASVLAIMGAVIGEFVGARYGLGHLVVYAGETLNMNLVFASILVLIIIGALFQAIVNFITKKTLFWVGR